jgi:hypothetical protein
MTFVPFHDADDIGDRFLALLSKHNIHPHQAHRLRTNYCP